MTESLSIVWWCLDPPKITATEFNIFVRHVTTTDRGIRQISRLRKIHDAAGRSIGLPVDDAAVYEAAILTDRFKAVEKELKQVMDPIDTVSREQPSYYALFLANTAIISADFLSTDAHT